MQDLALKASHATNPVASLIEAPVDKAGRSDVAKKFQQLLQKLTGQKPRHDDAVNAEPVDLNLTGQKLNFAGQKSLLIAADDKANLLLSTGVAGKGVDYPSCFPDATLDADVMAELAALMQVNPQLQQLITDKADLMTLNKAIEFIKQGDVSALAGLKLSADAEDLLQQLAANPDELANLDAAVQKLIKQPELFNAFIGDKKSFLASIDQKQDPADTKDVPVDGEKPKDFDGIKLAVEANGEKPKIKLPVDGARNILAEARSLAEVVVNDAANGVKMTMAEAALNAANGQKPRVTADEAAVLASDVAVLPFDQALDHAAQMPLAFQNKLSLVAANSADAYAAQARTGVATPHVATMQVAIQLQRSIQAGRERGFFVQLQPEELGKIEVTLKFDGNRVRALISAEKEETLELLKKDSSALNKSLQTAGLETDASSLEFSLHENFQAWDRAHQNRQQDDRFGTMLATDKIDHVTNDLPMTHLAIMENGRVDVKL